MCLIVLIPAVLFAGCSLVYHGLSEQQELVRVASPSSVTDAVLVKVGSLEGATGGSSLDLHLVPAGGDAENLPASERLLTADGLDDLDDGLKLRWRGESLLEVHYDAARITSFRNYKVLENKQGERYVVELRLVAPGDSGALPEGYYSDDERWREGVRAVKG